MKPHEVNGRRCTVWGLVWVSIVSVVHWVATEVVGFLGFLVIVIILLLVLGGESHTPPDNAIVNVNRMKGIYYAPPLVQERRDLERKTWRDVRRSALRPDKQSEKEFEHSMGPVQTWLERLHMTRHRCRWNKDGTWNW